MSTTSHNEWARTAVAAMLARVLRATAKEYARMTAELHPPKR